MEWQKKTSSSSNSGQQFTIKSDTDTFTMDVSENPHSRAISKKTVYLQFTSFFHMNSSIHIEMTVIIGSD